MKTQFFLNSSDSFCKSNILVEQGSATIKQSFRKNSPQVMLLRWLLIKEKLTLLLVLPQYVIIIAPWT